MFLDATSSNPQDILGDSELAQVSSVSPASSLFFIGPNSLLTAQEGVAVDENFEPMFGPDNTHLRSVHPRPSLSPTNELDKPAICVTIDATG